MSLRVPGLVACDPCGEQMHCKNTKLGPTSLSFATDGLPMITGSLTGGMKIPLLGPTHSWKSNPECMAVTPFLYKKKKVKRRSYLVFISCWTTFYIYSASPLVVDKS